MSLPNDPIILLSVLNTYLRDFYPNLEVCCKEKDVEIEKVIEKMKSIGYIYSAERNQFIRG